MRSKKILIYIGIFLNIILLVFVLPLIFSYSNKLALLKTQLAKIDSELLEWQVKKEESQMALNNIITDKGKEKVLRSQYNMKKEGEVVYIINNIDDEATDTISAKDKIKDTSKKDNWELWRDYFINYE